MLKTSINNKYILICIKDIFINTKTYTNNHNSKDKKCIRNIMRKYINVVISKTYT